MPARAAPRSMLSSSWASVCSLYEFAKPHQKTGEPAHHAGEGGAPFNGQQQVGGAAVQRQHAQRRVSASDEREDSCMVQPSQPGARAVAPRRNVVQCRAGQLQRQRAYKKGECQLSASVVSDSMPWTVLRLRRGPWRLRARPCPQAHLNERRARSNDRFHLRRCRSRSWRASPAPWRPA